METDTLEVVLCHLQHIVAVGKEHIAPLNILCHVLIFAFLEVLKFGGIVALYPTGLVEVHRLPATFCIVLVLQTILNNLELQLPHRAYELATIVLINKKLCNTLAHQLVDTLCKLLGLHGVGILYVLEHLGREAGQALEMKILALGECVAYFEVTRIGQAYDITRICLLNGALALCHELCGRRETKVFAQTYVAIRCVAHKFTRTYFAESDARTVVGVDVCSYLEDETCELGVLGVYHTLHSLHGAGAGCNLHKAVEQLLDTEIV